MGGFQESWDLESLALPWGALPHALSIPPPTLPVSDSWLPKNPRLGNYLATRRLRLFCGGKVFPKKTGSL